MTKIYAFVRGRLSSGDLCVTALAENGICLASHISSSVAFAQQDIGVTSTRKHEVYRKFFPKGFEMIWVDDPGNHPGVQAALELNRSLA